MSTGRPNNPFHWADTANFPAGANPWNGQPTKVAPSGDIYTPNLTDPAEYKNYILNKITNDVQALFDYVGQLPALNWPYQHVVLSSEPSVANDPAVLTGMYFPAGAAWDPIHHRWGLIAADSGPNLRVYDSTDGYHYRHISQNVTTTSSATIESLCWNSLGNRLNWIDGGTGDFWTCPSLYLGESVTAVSHSWIGVSTASAANGNMVNYHDSFFWTVKDSSPSTNPPMILTTADNGTTITVAHVMSEYSSRPTAAFIACASDTNPDMILVVNIEATASFIYYLSTDGVTFTPQDLSLSITGLSTGKILDLKYSAAIGKFVVMVVDSLLVPTFWSSSNGINWTQEGGFAAAVTQSCRLAILGNLWLVSTTITDDIPMVYSVDRGATWRTAGLRQTGDFWNLFAGDRNFVAISGTDNFRYAASLNIGFDSVTPNT